MLDQMTPAVARISEQCREAQSFVGEAVDVGRLHARGAVATHIAVAEVVRIDQNDVRRPIGAAGKLSEPQGTEQCQKLYPARVHSFHLRMV
jgi:hypothetical protein